jgi:hypothetical protein
VKKQLRHDSAEPLQAPRRQRGNAMKSNGIGAHGVEQPIRSLPELVGPGTLMRLPHKARRRIEQP